MTTTTERPILFSPGLIQAIRDGRKTETRRVIAPQPNIRGNIVAAQALFSVGGVDFACPYGRVEGDRIWVRETWAAPALCDRQSPSEIVLRKVVYRADHLTGRPPFATGRWRPSIHMPRWASRLILEVEYIRPERLFELTEAGAQAEGLKKVGDKWQGKPPRRPSEKNLHDSARDAFRELWDHINGERSDGAYRWERNPWVWAVTFRLLEDRTSDISRAS